MNSVQLAQLLSDNVNNRQESECPQDKFLATTTVYLFADRQSPIQVRPEWESNQWQWHCDNNCYSTVVGGVA